MSQNNPCKYFPFDSQVGLSYLYLIKWFFLSVSAGIVGSCVVRSFIFLSRLISSFLLSYPVPLPLWTVIGALVAGGVIYKLQPHAAGEGIPSYIRGIRTHKGDLLFSVTFFKYWAALATLSTFGNGGVIGPLGRTTAGIMSILTRGMKKLNVGFSSDDLRTASICGLAATVGAVFHSSIGGGIFAVEIIQKAKMGYKDLFPAILTSATSTFFCKAVGWNSFYQINAVDSFMEIDKVGWLLALTILLGISGGLYPSLYALIVRIFKRKEGNVVFKVIVGSLVASLIAWSINPELLGTSNQFIAAIFSGDMNTLTGRLHGIESIGLLLLIMLMFKAFCNCITVGCGMSAGFTGPAAIIGMLLGASAACFLGIPIGSPTYFAFTAAGFSGMLASSMNVPISSAVMAAEIFGLQYSFPGGLAAIVGFQVTRHQTIYDYALAGAGLRPDE
ncbi:MAG: hypothetical protein GF401_17980 [Chitinivibrionales bacterium]|nr:hypothetical protein [Chitinivibrionales bacterium]